MENIKKFNTIEELESYRTQINEACDKRSEYLTLIKKASTLTDMSFPYLKESFDNFSQALFFTKNGRDIIAKYIVEVKRNKDLSSLYDLCESIKNTNESSDINYFIDFITNTDWNINKTNLEEGRKRIGEIVAEAYVVIGKQAEELLPEQNADIEDAIRMISENKKTKKNISEYSQAIKVIRENVESKKAPEKVYEVKNIDSLVNAFLENVNTKFNNLSDEEKETIKNIVESSDKKSAFDKCKNLCIEKIESEKKKYEESGDSSVINRLDSIMESVRVKEYSNEKDLDNLIEMIKIFE